MKLIICVFSTLSFLSSVYAYTPYSVPLLKSPENFQVTFKTTKGVLELNVTRSWAPYGADRFYTLLQDSYYNENGFFRVVSNFVAQFGISGIPEISAKWENEEIPNDPVVQSNLRGFVSFAAEMNGTKSCCRTTQLYINIIDNAYLDSYGFAPFAKVTKGIEYVDLLYSGYGENPDQGEIYKQGNAYLTSHFPLLDYLVSAVIVTN